MIQRGRIRKWYLTGGFVAVVAGLTVTGSLAAVADRRVPDPQPSATSVAGSQADEAGERADQPGWAVACDANELIAAVLRANRDGGRIQLAPGCTYVLTTSQDGNGLPVITERVTIVGPDATITRAANAPGFRFFTVEPGGELTLRGITLAGGLDTSGNGGGAILVQAGGFAALTDTTLDNNQTNTDGGAILSRGVLALTQATLIHNIANGESSRGGGIASLAGQVTVDGSRLDRNAAPSSGGGSPNRPSGGALFSDTSVVVIRNSRANNNRSEWGGGLRLGGPSTIALSTISDNRASYGGGLYVNADATVTVRHGLISGNSIDHTGGGIHTAGNLLLADTRVTGNSATYATAGIQTTGLLTVRGGSVDANTAFGGAR